MLRRVELDATRDPRPQQANQRRLDDALPVEEVIAIADVLSDVNAAAGLQPVDAGPLSASRRLAVSVAGADSNFAIAMTRLGWPAIWLSAVSQDQLGDLVVEMIGAAGVDVSRVRRDPDHPTGVLVKFREDGQTRVVYYRRGSAASAFDPDWLDPSLFETAALLHVNGVTCALSPSCAA